MTLWETFYKRFFTIESLETSQTKISTDSAVQRPADAPAATATRSPAEVLGQPQNLCAVGIIVCFFLPWAQLFMLNASGFQLQQLGSYGTLAWVIPLLAAATLIAAFNGSANKALPLATGCAPFLGLAYALAKAGGDLFHVLAIGAYLTLLAGAGLIAFSLSIIGNVAHVDGASKEPTDLAR